ncbi:MAG: DUF3102 domain-containing protein [Prevotella sp.]|nr:DUF3102 domain-containing protein [Prevotella sp.]
MAEAEIMDSEYTRAVVLDKRIKASAQMAQEALFEMCTQLKEMKDGKLYKELGYLTFEDYAEAEVGLARRQAGKYVKVAETFRPEMIGLDGNKNAHPGAQNGITKLYLLTKLDEVSRTQLIESGQIDSMTKADLEEHIRQLKELVKASQTSETKAKESQEQAEREVQRMAATVNMLRTDKNNLIARNDELNIRVRELEERPVEVAVAEDTEEMAKLRLEYEDKLATIRGQAFAYETKLKNAETALRASEKRARDMQANFVQNPNVVEVENYTEAAKAYCRNLQVAVNDLITFCRKFPNMKDSAINPVKNSIDELKGFFRT